MSPREREFIGEGEDRIEVTGESDRALTMRIGTYALKAYQMTATLEGRVLAVEGSVKEARKEIRAIANPENTGTFQAIDPIKATLKARIEDKHDPMTKADAAAFMQEMLAKAKQEERNERLTKIDEKATKAAEDRRKILVQVLGGLILLTLGGCGKMVFDWVLAAHH